MREFLQEALLLGGLEAESRCFSAENDEAVVSMPGFACVPPSCPQFIVMGPLFHFLKAGLAWPGERAFSQATRTRTFCSRRHWP